MSSCCLIPTSSNPQNYDVRQKWDYDIKNLGSIKTHYSYRLTVINYSSFRSADVNRLSRDDRFVSHLINSCGWNVENLKNEVSVAPRF